MFRYVPCRRSSKVAHASTRANVPFLKLYPQSLKIRKGTDGTLLCMAGAAFIGVGITLIRLANWAKEVACSVLFATTSQALRQTASRIWRSSGFLKPREKSVPTTHARCLALHSSASSMPRYPVPMAKFVIIRNLSSWRRTRTLIIFLHKRKFNLRPSVFLRHQASEAKSGASHFARKSSRNKTSGPSGDDMSEEAWGPVTIIVTEYFSAVRRHAN